MAVKKLKYQGGLRIGDTLSCEVLNEWCKKQNKYWSSNIELWLKNGGKYDTNRTIEKFAICNNIETIILSSCETGIVLEGFEDFMKSFNKPEESKPASEKTADSVSDRKIAVYTGKDVEKNKQVIAYVRGVANYDSYSEYINLEDGCHYYRKWYEDNGYFIITFEEFERTYLNKQTSESNKSIDFYIGGLKKDQEIPAEIINAWTKKTNKMWKSIGGWGPDQGIFTGSKVFLDKFEFKNGVPAFKLSFCSAYFALEGFEQFMTEHLQQSTPVTKSSNPYEINSPDLKVGDRVVGVESLLSNQSHTNQIGIIVEKDDSKTPYKLKNMGWFKKVRRATPEEIEKYGLTGRPVPLSSELSPVIKQESETWKVGDWITITHSTDDWVDEMNKYIGTTHKLTSVEFNGNHAKFDDYGGWSWRFSNGHFRKATQEEIDKSTGKLWEPAVGDWITITKSDNNWNPSGLMDHYVGKTYCITAVGPIGQCAKFEGSGRWTWNLLNKHYRKATLEEIARANSGFVITDRSSQLSEVLISSKKTKSITPVVVESVSSPAILIKNKKTSKLSLSF